jgi:hypothetical protein
MAVIKTKPKNAISGHVMYLGPHIGTLGLHYNKTFLPNNDFSHFQPYIDKCPALAEMFVPIEKIAEVMRELNFDYARNMRGGTGPYPTFYRQIQSWLKQAGASKTAQQGTTLKTHHHA